jgi:hypothetical protein
MRARWFVLAGAALALQSTARAGEELQEFCVRAGIDAGVVDDVALAPIPEDQPRPDANYLGRPELEVHGFPEDRVVLMRWEIPPAITGSSATAVKLRVHVAKQSKSIYGVFPLLREWAPAEATWIGPTADTKWGDPGASGPYDFAQGRLLGRFAADHPIVDVDLDGGVALLNQWSTASAYNFGFVIRNLVALDSARFYSGDADEVGLRPALVITSTTGADDVILQHGDAGYWGEVDTTLADSAAPNQNNQYLAVEGATFGGSNSVAEPVVSLLRFDLSEIPALARVVDARLELWAPAEAYGNVAVDGVSREWIDQEATWVQATNATHWSRPGALAVGSDRRGIAAAAINVSGGRNAVSLTDAGVALVQEWIWDPSANNGFLLGANDPDTLVIFSESNTSFESERPMLCVRYKMDRQLNLQVPCGCSAGGGLAALALPLLLRSLRRRRT